MKDEFDVEGVLRRYDAGPGERTKEPVMDRFRRTRGAHAVERDGLWWRPVPLYRVAMAVLLLVGLSFTAGRELSSGTGADDSEPAQAPASHAAATDEIDWVPAESDFL